MVSYTFISAAVLAIAGISPWSAMAAPVSSSNVTSADGGPPGGDNGNHFGWYKHEQDGNQGDENNQGDNGHHYGWEKHNHTSAGQNVPSSSFGGNHHDPMPTAPISIMPLPSMSASLTASASSTQSASDSSKPTSSGSSATPSSSGSAGGASNSSDQDTILQLHNKFRSQHSAPALKWNETLAEFAQNWSDGCKFEHSQNGKYGENLAWNYGDWEKAITAWYDEEKDYDYNSASFSSGTGHFTQIVWVDTTEIGCGVSDCSNGPIYTCSYYPPGNVMGEFKDNVLPN